MKRKQLYKRLFSGLLIGTMLLTEVPVMAEDFSDSEIVSQDVAEYVGEENTAAEITEEESDAEISVDSEEETEVDFSDEESTADTDDTDDADAADVDVFQDALTDTDAEAVGETQDEDNLLGGGTVVESSTTEWRYIYNKLGAALIEYKGSDENVTIPASIGGNKVIACKKDLLKDKKDSIKSVVIEAELTSLPDGFFSNFRHLESVSLPDTMTDMGERTFYWCDNLKTVKLPEKLEKIRSSAFNDCDKLEDLQIPDNVTEIGSSAFWSCDSLRSIKLSANLKKIGYDAFGNCSSLKEVELPEGVESVGSYAFESCTSLEKIVLSDSIKTTYWEGGSVKDYGLGSSAFKGCSALKSVKLPKDLEAIASSLFEGCTSLKSIEIPASVTKIESNAFKDCASLSKIKLSDKVTEIGDSAFKDCLMLTNLTVYNAMKTFGSDVFTGDPFLVMSCVNNSEAVAYAKNNKILYTTVEYEASGSDCTTKIPKDTFTQLQEGQKLVIDAGDISMTFDADAVNAIKNSGAGSDVTLDVKGVEKGETGNQAQDTIIEKFVNNDGKVLNLSLTDDNNNHVAFSKDNTGSFSITLPFTAPAGEKPAVFCVYEDGRLETVQSNYDAAAHTITFETPHFSVFAIGSEKIVPNSVWIGDIADQYYTGKPVEPEILVYDHSVLLKKGTDYTVTFTDNTNPGTATAVVKMQGKYTGEYKTTFKIVQKHVHKGTEISKKATCTEAGQKAYYTCDCGKIFWDKECTKEITDKNELKNLTIPALGHNMVLAAAKVKATNTANGSEAKYRCSRCGMTQGGQNIARIARVTLYKGVNKTYNLTPGKWKLTKTKAATLKKNRLTVKKTGTVKVKDQITKQTVTIRIVNPTLSVNKKKITLKAKKKYQLKVKTVPVQKVKYSSSNKKIATVTSSGQILAKKKGTVTITIKCGSLKKTCKVTVK